MTTPRPRHSRLRATVLSLAALAAIVTACTSAINRAGTAPVTPDARVVTQSAQAASASQPYFEYQLDEPVRMTSTDGAPKYPAVQKAAGLEAEVLSQFIVNADGVVETGSFKVLKGTVSSGEGAARTTVSSGDDVAAFETAVRDAVVTMRFASGKLRGVPVRQVVQMPFVFALSKK